MPQPFWELTVRSEFCAAHALRHYKGKCEQLHGHNYAVKVVVEGNTLSEDTQLLMDFGDLKALLKTVLEDLDHKHLNEVPPFDVSNPSSENIARYIFTRMVSALPETVRLQGVTVAEKGIQSATYSER